MHAFELRRVFLLKCELLTHLETPPVVQLDVPQHVGRRSCFLIFLELHVHVLLTAKQDVHTLMRARSGIRFHVGPSVSLEQIILCCGANRGKYALER